MQRAIVAGLAAALALSGCARHEQPQATSAPVHVAQPAPSPAELAQANHQLDDAQRHVIDDVSKLAQVQTEAARLSGSDQQSKLREADKLRQRLDRDDEKLSARTAALPAATRPTPRLPARQRMLGPMIPEFGAEASVAKVENGQIFFDSHGDHFALAIDDGTQVLIDGRQAEPTDLRSGADAQVTYAIGDDGPPVARLIQVGKPTPGAGLSAGAPSSP